MKFLGRRNKLFISFFIAVLILLFFANVFQSQVKPFFYSISNPFQKFFWQIGNNCSNFLSAIVWVNHLKEENNDFYYRNQELLYKIAVLEQSEKENEQLKKALDIELDKEFNLEFIQLIGKDISQDFILIDKGAKDGMAKDMPVISSQKVLLGKISEVYDNYSKVMLISHKDCSFDAKIEGKDISGIIRGKGGLEIFLDLIPQNADISENDTVVSSNLAGFFPANLIIGKVSKAKRNDVDAFQQADISPAFDIKNINYFFVITNSR